jgi:hypothetical protein
VPLSDVEKRMMYFTEGPDATEDPAALNDDFEAEYDMPTYEAKMSELLHRAYARVKKENPETARTWNESIRILKKGDHYILVLWGVLRPPYDNLKLISTAFLVVAFFAWNYSHCGTLPFSLEPRTATPQINTCVVRAIALISDGYCVCLLWRFPLDF